MFSWIRRRLTFANIAMTLALVFAMSGGAYAANKYLITSTKQIKPSVLKQIKGKAGANGAQGTTGPAGAQGPQGSVGAQGPQGPAGAAGKDGAPGKDGKEGKTGKEGSPWTAGGTLPSGKTEKGTWNLGPVTAASLPPFIGEFRVVGAPAASFAVPLAGALDEEHVHYIKENEAAPSGCGTGTVSEPTAETGNLCVYAGAEAGVESQSVIDPATGAKGAGTAGANLAAVTKREGEEQISARGTWAVTAE